MEVTYYGMTAMLKHEDITVVFLFDCEDDKRRFSEALQDNMNGEFNVQLLNMNHARIFIGNIVLQQR